MEWSFMHITTEQSVYRLYTINFRDVVVLKKETDMSRIIVSLMAFVFRQEHQSTHNIHVEKTLLRPADYNTHSC